MQQVIKPLVLTPKPFKYESLKGFILRISEANGYHSPSVMLNCAGLSQGELVSIIPPFEKLAPLFNLTIPDLITLGYRKPLGKRSARHVWIYNHRLPTYYLNIKHPKICTECIITSGFIESFWDLKHAIACPKHNRLLLKICPNCKKQLSWYRPGMLICACGCDLSSYVGDVVESQRVLGVLSLLRNKLLGQLRDFNRLEPRFGFPVEHLKTLTMAELISILLKFENIRSNAILSDIHNGEYQQKLTFELAGQALNHWPDGLYQYLDSFNNERTSIQGFGLRKQFESFYGSLFKTNVGKEKMAFIKEAFIKFGAEEWKKGHVSNKLHSNKKEFTNIVGINGLAEKLGVTSRTAKAIVKIHSLASKESYLNGRTRHYFDVGHGLPLEPVFGVSYTVRKAATCLGIPVSVLRILREQKCFEIKHIPVPLTSYHLQDLSNFRDKLLKKCPPNKNFTIQIHITLKQVMLMKLGSDEIKASFITGVIDRQLQPVGKISENLGDMFFDRALVHEFMLEKKSQIFGLTSVVLAAKKLHCDPLTIRGIYHTGLLQGVIKPSGLFIFEESLIGLINQYISCAAIASMLKTNSEKIVKYCMMNNINLNWFPRFGMNNPQPFIKRDGIWF